MRVRFRHRFAAGVQRTVCRVVLFFLFRALNVLAVRDSRVAAEIAPWPEERVLGLEVPGGPALYIARRGKRLSRLKSAPAPDISSVSKVYGTPFTSSPARWAWPRPTPSTASPCRAT